MMIGRWTIAVILLLGLSACSNAGTPLIFGQSDTIGITVSGSLPDQGGEITVGYKSRNIAIVPTAIVSEVDGQVTNVRGTATNGFIDALSVLGQFEANVRAAQPEVGLGKFFATGIAAQKLADGFAAELGYIYPPPAPAPE